MSDYIHRYIIEKCPVPVASREQMICDGLTKPLTVSTLSNVVANFIGALGLRTTPLPRHEGTTHDILLFAFSD